MVMPLFEFVSSLVLSTKMSEKSRIAPECLPLRKYECYGIIRSWALCNVMKKLKPYYENKYQQIYIEFVLRAYSLIYFNRHLPKRH